MPRKITELRPIRYGIIAIANLERRIVAYVPKEDMTARNSINIWMCGIEEVPTKGRTKEPMMFNDYLLCPIR